MKTRIGCPVCNSSQQATRKVTRIKETVTCDACGYARERVKGETFWKTVHKP